MCRVYVRLNIYSWSADENAEKKEKWSSKRYEMSKWSFANATLVKYYSLPHFALVLRFLICTNKP